ncbi:unnamed protein product [Clonostachys rhizophaga]|uniref:Secondary metabolism regulator LAE1 n=1 Tax=Clonostachys rhizophaga TaxID=160324 RepID=A0A9N9VWF5_9HYPO|nr:unnamed protein product [Clonostachys rhizophaga]
MASSAKPREPNSPAERETTDAPPFFEHLEGQWRHGRYYGDWKPWKYIFPIDAEELNRADMLHKFFSLANDEEITTVKLRSDRQMRVMDLGTGTSIWATLFLRKFTQAHVLGVDINRIQPPTIPIRLSTIQFDLEEPCWDKLWQDCDLIHIRQLLGCIETDLWPTIYKNIFNHLVPGSGYIEQTEIDWDPQWDESGDIPSPSSLKEWADRFLAGLDRSKRSGRVDPAHRRRMLEDAGFTEIEVKTTRLYASPWSRDERANDIARWFNMSFINGIEGMSLTPMIDYGDMRIEEVRNLCHRVDREMAHLQYHGYMTLYTWKARRAS